MDDLRRFIDLRGGQALPVYSTPEGLERVREIYPYAIRERPEFKGYPAFNLEVIPDVLETEGGTVQGTLLPHGRFSVLGLVFTETGSGKRLAYYTDCKHLTPHAKELAAEADLVVLDALRPMPHPTHMTLHEAVQTAEELGARRTLFTHMSYYLDDKRDGKDLPESMAFAYDGLRVTI
jgi:phosphoribosyl 1,2-cyclic phosphate phosphodiesterase